MTSHPMVERPSTTLNPQVPVSSILKTQSTPEPKRNIVFFEGMDEIENLSGPWPMDPSVLLEMFPEPTPGIYALGTKLEDGKMLVCSIGMALDHLGGELSHRIPTATHFMMRTFPEASLAFHAECRLYHRFGRILAIQHPMRDFKTQWTCPNCGIFNPGP